MKIKDLLKLLEEEKIDPEADLASSLLTCCGAEYSEISELEFDKWDDNDPGTVRIEIPLGSCRAYGNKAGCKNDLILMRLLDRVVDYAILADLLTCDDQELRDYVADWAKRRRK